MKDYREQLMLSLSSARDLATQSNSEGVGTVQAELRQAFDLHNYTFENRRLGAGAHATGRVGTSGPQRNLLRPWHGPYRIISISDPDVLVTKVYFPQYRTLQVHQSRVKACPPKFPPAFYWYGGRRSGPGRTPRWLSQMILT